MGCCCCDKSGTYSTVHKLPASLPHNERPGWAAAMPTGYAQQLPTPVYCNDRSTPLRPVPSPSWDSTAHHGMNCLLPCLLHWSCDACRHLAAIRLRTTASSHYTENVLLGHAHREGRLSELVHGAEIHLAQSRNRYLGYLELRMLAYVC